MAGPGHGWEWVRCSPRIMRHLSSRQDGRLPSAGHSPDRRLLPRLTQSSRWHTGLKHTHNCRASSSCHLRTSTPKIFGKQPSGPKGGPSAEGYPAEDASRPVCDREAVSRKHTLYSDTCTSIYICTCITRALSGMKKVGGSLEGAEPI